ncbi:hypothetical protein VTH82DRAFT_5349 [Thermothelomyces myriococcoides]
MAGASLKKRSFSDGPKGRAQQPTKKQKKVAEYHSSSEDSASDDEGGPVPSHLLDSSDEDLENVEVDDGASTADSESDSGSDSLSEPEPTPKRKTQPGKRERFVAKDAPSSEDEVSSDELDQEREDDEDSDADSDSDAASHSDASSTRQQGGAGKKASKSKRNDPTAFATSISKMLSSKVPTSRRADPIVARSAAAAERARQAADSALEAKARRRLREQKRLAMEKGRVRDVLVASKTRTLDLATEEILAAERRLRKTAQRGVVKLFNAVRAAQVKAAEAERAARREGVIGVKRKEEKVAEMSRKGFLDLIANSGGGLKKGGVEEA